MVEVRRLQWVNPALGDPYDDSAFPVSAAGARPTESAKPDGVEPAPLVDAAPASTVRYS
jgi:hypothetical protein